MGRRRREPRIAMVSLGCAKNLVDTEVMLGRLGGEGFVISTGEDGADLVVINTCGFIQTAIDESSEVIREALELRRAGRVRGVIVAGCLAERRGEALLEEFPGLSGLVGPGRRKELPEACRAALDGETPVLLGAGTEGDDTGRLRLTPRHYTYLRVSDGCSNRCAYCTIPSIRGDLRSRPIDEVVRTAEELAADGVVELCLVGQDTAGYGRDLYGEPRLAALLPRLAAIDGIEWIRPLYLHPAHIDSGLIDAIAGTDAVCNYLDMPIQHADDRILAAMGRRITREGLAKLVGDLRRGIPDVTIRTTVMVGFPGETAAAFEGLMAFLREAAFERIGGFVYSPEEGTPAASLPDRVDEAEATDRLAKVMDLAEVISQERSEKLIGTTERVIVDGKAGDRLWSARSARHAPEVDGIVLLSARKAKPGMFTEAEITGVEGHDLLARKGG